MAKQKYKAGDWTNVSVFIKITEVNDFDDTYDIVINDILEFHEVPEQDLTMLMNPDALKEQKQKEIQKLRKQADELEKYILDHR